MTKVDATSVQWGQSSNAHDGGRRGRRLPARLLSLGLLMSLAMMLAGCGGCDKDPKKPTTVEELEQAELERRKRLAEEKKPDFEFLRLSTQPNNVTTIGNSFKPGHWTAATLEARANQFDFKGELVTEVVDKQGDPVNLEGLPFTVETSRPLILPEKQKKYLELTFFAPPQIRSSRLRTRLLTGRYGRSLMNDLMIIRPVPAHQYYFVVLASTPDNYSFLKDVHSIRAPSDRFVDPQSQAHYRVVAPRIRFRTPLPSGALQWTTIAYVLWDNLEPDKLSPQQQQAMVDWLHWGGQLIVSGPETLDTLSGSFLEPYLPVDATGTRELTKDDLAELSDSWSRGERGLVPRRPWSGVDWTMRSGAVAVPNTGKLLVETRAGRGRVIVTNFSLAQREIRSWFGFDEMLNACLLKRPARRIKTSDDVDTPVAVEWVSGALYEAKFNSRLRYFTRDAERAESSTTVQPNTANADNTVQQNRVRLGRTFNRSYSQSVAYDEQPPVGPGVAAWNDGNMVTQEARDALREAAGIVVPKATFVITLLGIYVVVLAPLNWMVFTLLRRIEWAWIAVPIIAVACATVVVRLAQLDIGFARSRTEVAVVEVQGGYDRAHVTRYTAIYTSLSTSYDLEFEDPMAVALPLATGKPMGRNQGREKIHLRRDSRFRMDRFQVGSNTTEMIHSEQMLPLGGPIRLVQNGGTQQVVNDSHLTLEGTVVVGPGGAAWLGRLTPGTAVDLVMEPIPGGRLFAKQRNASPHSASVNKRRVLNLRALIELAESGRDPQETRLVAWTDEDLAGLAIDPPAKQNRQGSLIVAHLDYGKMAPPERDEYGQTTASR